MAVIGPLTCEPSESLTRTFLGRYIMAGAKCSYMLGVLGQPTPGLGKDRKLSNIHGVSI